MNVTVTEVAILVLAIWPVLAAVAAMTKTPKDDQALAILRKVLDMIVFNWGHAKNELPNKEKPDA
ncbi:MAG: hypothetical protein BA863_00980 [Desulfovibrio sp. S3730MH75]|nr:MAG: hypothetical protein BA863_00980 [Desulfovibrio sp. S3730MH75]